MVGNFDVDVEDAAPHRAPPRARCRRRCATTRRSWTASTPTSRAGTSRSSTRRTSPSTSASSATSSPRCWSQLRRTSRLDVLQGRLEWGSQLSGRDRKAANNTVDGLLRLLYPDPEMEVPDEFLAWAATLALEMRRRVKEAQAFIGAAEFGNVDLSFSIGGGPRHVVYCDESLKHRLRTESEARPHGDASRRQRGAARTRPCRSQVVRRSHGRRLRRRRHHRRPLRGPRGARAAAASRRSTASATSVEGEERAFKLFDNAAGYDAVRREIGALRKVHHPNVVEVYLGRQDRQRRVVPDHGVHRGRARSPTYATGQEASARPRSDRRRARRPRRAHRHPPRQLRGSTNSTRRSASGEISAKPSTTS